jgi:hypothetical protein
MRNRFVLIGVALLAGSLLSAATALAQQETPTCGGSQSCGQIKSDNTAYGTTAAEFLLLPATARGSALGGSYAALVTDVSAVYFNPAGLSQMERGGLMASTMNYVADTRYSFAAIGFPFGGGSKAIGVSLANFGFSNQPVYTVEDPTGTSGEVYSVSETSVGLTYSQQFSDRFAAGVTGKFIDDVLGRVSGTAFAVDFGTSFHATIGGRPIRASFVIQNLGTTLTHSGDALDALVLRSPPSGVDSVPQEPARATLQTKAWSLPITFRVAMAYDLVRASSGRFSLMGEFTQPNNTQPGFNLGGEYALTLGTSGFAVAARAGMTYWPDESMTADSTVAGFATGLTNQTIRWSAGGGLHYGRGAGFGFGVDYAYRSMGLLGGVNMLTVGVDF